MPVGQDSAFRDEVGREGAQVQYLTAATTLEAGSKVVKAIIPVTGTYAVTLPQPELCPHGSVIEIEFTRATGYSNGTVTVVINGTTYTYEASDQYVRVMFVNRHSTVLLISHDS